MILPANTLEAGHSYFYDLDFSDRVFAPAPGSALDANLGFDVRTEAQFTTAAAAATVPEPGSLALLPAEFPASKQPHDAGMDHGCDSHGGCRCGGRTQPRRVGVRRGHRQ